MRCRLPQPSQLTPVLLLATVFLAAAANSFAAQPANGTPYPWDFSYDKAHEITIEATVQEVVSTRGTPDGLHLVVTAPEGMFDAHLGPFLTKETIDALHAGMMLQITGALHESHGKQYLLARQITIDGRIVILRNQRGYLVRPLPPRTAARSKESLLQPEVNGGAR